MTSPGVILEDFWRLQFFFDFLGEGGGGGAESHNIQPENHFIRKFTYKMVIWPKCDPKGSKMHVFLRTK